MQSVYRKYQMLARKENTLLNGRVKILQPETGFRVSQDAVFLAAAVHAEKNEKILDVGCGTGAAFLCLLERLPSLHITGIEVQEELITLAQENTALNKRDKNVTFIQGDIFDPNSLLKENSFDHVMTNPPFFEGMASPYPSKALAHTQSVSLEKWILFCLRMLKSRGILTLIHQAERLDEIISIFYRRFGDIEIFPLFSKEGEKSLRVIISAQKNSKGKTKLYPGLVLHQKDGTLTPQAEDILRKGKL